MADKFEELVDKYARLVVEVGINVQKSEPVRISCPVDGAYFARALAKFAYMRGASDVVIDWIDDEISHMGYEYKTREQLEIIPEWSIDKSEYYFKKGVNLIKVYASDPGLLADIDPEKVAAYAKAHAEAFKKLMKYTMNDICSWCVVSIPQKNWANKVFPDLSPEDACEKLWELIFKTTRMKEKDPVAAWEKHINSLNEKAEFLQKNKFDKLVYRSDNGTDLTIGLPKGHKWVSAVSKNAKGTRFVPNMPTEEVFTMPDRLRADGVVFSTKPLALNGNIIENMKLEFVNGRCEKFTADRGEEILRNFFEDDENSRYLGEVALVPFSSPINKSDVLFFNTLFDENASCHLAFGAAYPTTLEGGENMTTDELIEHGANDSINHEDFMIGSDDLNITGITEDGVEIEIFRKGEWTF